MGRSPVQAVASTTIAAVRPAIASAAIVVAVFCLTSFGVIVALGGASVGTIEVEVWYLTTRTLDLGRAAVLAAGQLLAVMLLVVWYQRLRPTSVARSAYGRRQVRARSERRWVVGAVVATAVVSGAPLVALVVRSLRGPEGWTVSNYRVLGPTAAGGDGWHALGYSLVGALVATVVALVIAAPSVAVAARHDRVGRWFEGVMVVPLALSAATLGLGFLVAFSGPTLDLRGTWIIVPLVQAAGAAPVVVRIVLTAARSIDRSLLDAAAVGGAGRLRRAVSVVWPALRHPIGVAAGFAFAMSVGEFGATVFLSRQDRPTVPVLIGRLLGRPGSANLGQALALSCVLGLIAAVSVVLVDRGTEDGPAF
jgi:thiamine transport system permease protein